MQSILAVLILFAVSAGAEDLGVPLIVTKKDGIWTVALDVLVNGHQRRFSLDTGASASEVKSDEFSVKYPVNESVAPLGTKTGPSGQKLACDWVSLQNVSVGDVTRPSVMASRCVGDGGFDNLGINFFSDSILSVDSDRLQLRLGSRRPTRKLNYAPLIRSGGDPVYGLIKIPVTLAGKNVSAAFDTGSGVTAVDLRFVKANPDKFELTGEGTASDITQTDFKVSVYRTKDFKIGSLEFGEISIVAFDFGSLRDAFGEDCPILLGNNVIFNVNWIFDLHASEWAAWKIAPR